MTAFNTEGFRCGGFNEGFLWLVATSVAGEGEGFETDFAFVATAGISEIAGVRLSEAAAVTARFCVKFGCRC